MLLQMKPHLETFGANVTFKGFCWLLFLLFLSLWDTMLATDKQGASFVVFAKVWHP